MRYFPALQIASWLALLFAVTVVVAAPSSFARAQGAPLNILAPHAQLPASMRSALAYADEGDIREGVTAAAPRSATTERLHRTVVTYPTREAPGTIIIDTANTYLYLVSGPNTAVRYGVGVGREGFTWSGVEHISHKAEWPDWRPPAAMLKRQPYLPRFMAGGEGNPLGARAMYLGSTSYRIHGTNDPSTIGKYVSSGCIRLTNQDVEDLYRRVQVGAKVVVLPQRRAVASR